MLHTGDMVQLKSGSDPMKVVSASDDGQIMCKPLWDHGDRQLAYTDDQLMKFDTGTMWVKF